MAPIPRGAVTGGPRARVQRASDFTVELCAGMLVAQGLLSDDDRRTAIAREATQRARLGRERTQLTGRALDTVEISPIEVIASLHFVDVRRPIEHVDEDKATAAIARALAVGYRRSTASSSTPS